MSAYAHEHAPDPRHEFLTEPLSDCLAFLDETSSESELIWKSCSNAAEQIPCVARTTSQLVSDNMMSEADQGRLQHCLSDSKGKQ